MNPSSAPNRSVVVVIEHRFRRTPDGRVWSPMFGYAVWRRYLDVFATVRVVARVLEVGEVDASYREATGHGVEFRPVPYYVGPLAYLRNREAVRRTLYENVNFCDALILRLPSNLSRLVADRAQKLGIPYAVELVADPWDMFSPGALVHPLRPLFRQMFYWTTRRICRSASAVLYVTERSLQQRYPASPHAVAVGISDVELTTDSFVTQPRDTAAFRRRPIRLIAVGMFNLLYKAQDVLVQAFAELRQKGVDAELVFVGDGHFRPQIEALAQKLQVAPFVTFKGQLAGGAAVWLELDRADVFVMPSRQEGLPRAMVEAMARGLPCVGSRVGGIPELLAAADIVSPGDVPGLSALLERLAQEPERLAEMSARNLARARDFMNTRWAQEREGFYRQVQVETRGVAECAEVRIFLEHRFKRTPDGRIWSPFFNYGVWKRYLEVFEQVVLCARVTDIPQATSDLAEVTGQGVKFVGLPSYQGPSEYLLVRSRFQRAIQQATAKSTAYIIRVPGNVADQAITALTKRGMPYAVEVVADPWDMFSPRSVEHPLRAIFRRRFRDSTRRHCAAAAAALYVTEAALQKKYPPHAGAAAFGASNVFLDNAAYREQGYPEVYFKIRPLRCICVGSFNLLYKAQDVLVEAASHAVAAGVDLQVVFVGDGKYREKIAAYARTFHNLDGRITFAGQIRGGEDVRTLLDQSQLFILPSRQEGLPRAALEAMARALPCIGTEVGGFPEILTPDVIIPPNHVASLAGCIQRLACNPARMAELSAANLLRAADFHRQKLLPKQIAFYRQVQSLALQKQVSL